ncbi:hypothetical protein ACSBR2_026407 [Camellia fascicularis]
MCWWFQQVIVVHIINSLPANDDHLQVRCQSKDDDLGMHTLTNGQEFNWKFHLNFQGSTLFFCHFYWDTKDISFDVYNRHIYPSCGTLESHVLNCYWSVRSDGFYLSDDNYSWKMINKWNN